MNSFVNMRQKNWKSNIRCGERSKSVVKSIDEHWWSDDERNPILVDQQTERVSAVSVEDIADELQRVSKCFLLTPNERENRSTWKITGIFACQSRLKNRSTVLFRFD